MAHEEVWGVMRGAEPTPIGKTRSQVLPVVSEPCSAAMWQPVSAVYARPERATLTTQYGLEVRSAAANAVSKEAALLHEKHRGRAQQKHPFPYLIRVGLLPGGTQHNTHTNPAPRAPPNMMQDIQLEPCIARRRGVRD